MDSEKTGIVIIGAGLTGLSIGHYLKKAGKSFVIVEKEGRAGGVINTITQDGFTYEAGPNTGVLGNPDVPLLFEDLHDRCTLETAGAKAKKRYILKNSKWTALPSGPISAISTPLFTMKDKLRILGEPFRKPGTEPEESVAMLVKRRLGESFLDYAVNPFISGVYAGDPEKLITKYALPKLYNLEQDYGSFIKGSIAKSRVKKTPDEKKATREVFSVKGGLVNLIKALSDETGSERLLTGCSNIVVTPGKPGFKIEFRDEKNNVRTFHSSIVITTAGGYALPEILPFISSAEMKNISVLNYAPVVQVSAGYRSWTGNKLDAFGGLVPAVEKKNILGILFPSAIFEGRAPQGGALLSVFLGGVRNPAMIKKNDSEIARIVLKEIAGTLSERREPDLFKVHRYAHAIPQYEKSSGLRFETIAKLQQDYPGLILAGNIRDGIGMADRIKQAKNIAESIVSM